MNIEEKLRRPFGEEQLQWRVQRSGVKKDKPWAIILPYVDARAIMDRLDEVLGTTGWTDSYEVLDKGVVCVLGISEENGRWVHKSDGSDYTDVEAFKGGISKAFVRTAVKFGVGRYLYDMPLRFANFVSHKGEGVQSAKIDGKFFNWVVPGSGK